jgi:UPF0176 protein
MMPSYTIITFYKLEELTDTANVQQDLLQFCITQNIKGTIILAPEGINGTVAGEKTAIESFIYFLNNYSGLANIDYKFSYSHTVPFKKLKIHIRKEVVTMGIETSASPKTGIPLSPEAWNDLIVQPDVLVVDTRNDFEVTLGSFKGAINPNTKKFSDFPEYVKNELNPAIHKKIAMCCTGGIRCEKASAYLLNQGFENVYQLQGGILRYLDQINNKESLWEGECFIFDERIVYSQFPTNVNEKELTPT